MHLYFSIVICINVNVTDFLEHVNIYCLKKNSYPRNPHSLTFKRLLLSLFSFMIVGIHNTPIRLDIHPSYPINILLMR